MYKIFKYTFIVLLLLVLMSCSSTEANKEPETMGEALKLSLNSEISAYTISQDYIKIISDEYVCEARMPVLIYAELEKIDWQDENRDEKYIRILSELKPDKVEARSLSKLTDEQISSLIGKKGQEMLDMGFNCYGYLLTDDASIFFLDKNAYTYKVTTEEVYQDSDTFDATDNFSKSTIKKIELASNK